MASADSTDERMPYVKTVEPVAAIVERLMRRGLRIEDKERVARNLQRIGYYRLNGYLESFEVPSCKADHTREHTFLPGVSFDDVISLYVFDRKLSLLIVEALERIEIALRSAWANTIAESTKDPHAWLNSTHFRDVGWITSARLRDHAVSALEKGRSNAKEGTALFHYYNHYSSPEHPPIWVMVEVLSFGELSHWYNGTKDAQLRKQIALQLNLPKPELASSTFAALTYLRNLCAHHGQCWDKLMLKEPPRLNEIQSELVYNPPDGAGVIKPDRHIYNYLVVLAFILNHLNPKSTWRARLVALVSERTPDQLKRMAFPADWHQRNVWVNPPREPAAVSGLESTLRDALRRHAAAEGVTVADAHTAILRAALLPVTTA